MVMTSGRKKEEEEREEQEEEEESESGLDKSAPATDTSSRRG